MQLWSILALASAVSAQTPSGAIYQVGNGVSAPEVIYQNQPEYSDEARRARLEGSVKLSLVIGADGRPTAIQVLKPIGMGLDDSAVAAVTGWRFKPAIKDGQPVAVEATIEVSFHLYANSDWHLNRAVFQSEPGISKPGIVRAFYPERTANPRFATFQIAFQIDEQGRPKDVRVVSSSDPSLNDEVIRLIREWRFLAAEKEGQPVALSAEFDFSLGEDAALARPAAVPRSRK